MKNTMQTGAQHYISSFYAYTQGLPEEVQIYAERLHILCDYPEEFFTHAHWEEMRYAIRTLEAYVAHTPDVYLKDFLLQADHYHNEIATQFKHRSIERVWETITPAIPDRLDDLGEGVYEAKWWKPVPMMDVELLLSLGVVSIDEQPFEPANLPGGLAVRFSLLEDYA